MKIGRIEHLGIACRSAEATAKFYAEVLGLPVVARETLEEMKLKVVRVKAGESVLELLEPLEGEAVVSKFLAERGEGFHHVCFDVDDVRSATAELRSRGLRPLWDEPRRGAGGRWVQFLRPKEAHGLLVELSGAR